MSPKPEQLVPQPKATPSVTDIADSIQTLRFEAQNRTEPIFAEIADEMEWLAREVLARESVNYSRGDR